MKFIKLNRNNLWNSLGSTLYGVNSFVMLTMVSRICTIQEIGAFGIAFTTAQLLYIIGLFGVSHYQMTDYKKAYAFADYARVRFFSCSIMMAVCGLSILVLRFSYEKSILTILLTIYMLLHVVGDLYQNLFFQNNRLDLSGSALFYRTLWPLLVFCVVLVVSKQLLVALILQILCNLITTLYYIKRVAPDFLQDEPFGQTEKASSVKLLLECFPLFISLLLMNLLLNSSKYGIEFLLDDVAQGYYSMIFIPAQVINLCSQFIFKPLLSTYDRLVQERQKKELFKVILRQLALVFCFTVACCLGAYVLGAPVLGFVYQKDLSNYIFSLLLVVLGGGVFAACQLMYYILVIMRKQKVIAGIYLIGGVITAPLTYFFVSELSIDGAALSFVLLHLLLLALYFVFLKRYKLE